MMAYKVRDERDLPPNVREALERQAREAGAEGNALSEPLEHNDEPAWGFRSGFSATVVLGMAALSAWAVVQWIAG